MKRLLLTLCLLTPTLLGMEAQPNAENASKNTGNLNPLAIKPIQLFKTLIPDLKGYVNALSEGMIEDKQYLESYGVQACINDRYLEKVPTPEVKEGLLIPENINAAREGQPLAICNRHKLIALTKHGEPLHEDGSQLLYIYDFDGHCVQTIKLIPNESCKFKTTLVPYAFSENAHIIVLMETVQDGTQLAHLYNRSTDSLLSTVDYDYGPGTNNEEIPLSFKNLFRVYITAETKIFFLAKEKASCVADPQVSEDGCTETFPIQSLNQAIWNEDAIFFMFEDPGHIGFLAGSTQVNEYGVVPIVYISYPRGTEADTRINSGEISSPYGEDGFYTSLPKVLTPIDNRHRNQCPFGCTEYGAYFLETTPRTLPTPLQPTTHEIWCADADEINPETTKIYIKNTYRIQPGLLESLTERDIRVINYLDGIYCSNEFEQLEKLDEQELHWLAMAFTFLPNYTREQFLQMIPNLKKILQKGLFLNLTEAEQQEKIKHFSSLPAFIKADIAKGLPERIAQVVLLGRKRKVTEEEVDLEHKKKK